MKKNKLNPEEQLEVVLALLRKEDPSTVLARRCGIGFWMAERPHSRAKARMPRPRS